MISNFKFQISNSSKGFTLLELVVVLALFMIILGVTVSLFISIVGHQKRILSQQELLSQMSYAQEHMSRALRLVTKDTTGHCLSDGGTSYAGYVYLLTHYNAVIGAYQGIKFFTQDGVCQEFFVDPKDNTLQEVKNSSLPQPIISSKFGMPNSMFILNGDKTLPGVTSAIEPRVTMMFNIQGQIFQTTVSQRNFSTK